MQKFTKAQLVFAMTRYNQEFNDNPEKFNTDPNQSAEEMAESQVDYLISLIPAE